MLTSLRFSLVLTSGLFLQSCISSPSSEYSEIEVEPSLDSVAFTPKTIDDILAADPVYEDPQPEIGEKKPVEELIDETPQEVHITTSPDIPMEWNEEVQKWIEFFTVKRRDLFQRYLNRGEKFRPMILHTLKEQNVPVEMYYLALIESGFVQTARSHASAVGIWQFIAPTATRYGLRVDRYVDERLDPQRATIAATLYLNDLNNVFDSWYLAMAAYNAGETRIMRAIMKGKTRDFWELARNKQLPRETRNYVPKFMAAMIVGQNLEKYGFTIDGEKSLPELVAVSVPKGISISKIADTLKLPSSTLEAHNKHLRLKMTPPGQGSYKIWVPNELENHFADAHEKLKGFAQVTVSTSKHRIRRGENLTSIAKKYGLTVAELKRMNNLSSNRIMVGRRLIVRGEASTDKSSKTSYHKVGRGENLTLIARKYSTSVNQIKKLNRLSHSRIYPGMRLQVSGDPTERYRVRRGDNLFEIARRFGLSVSELKKINRLKRNTIYAGQILRVAPNQG